MAKTFSEQLRKAIKQSGWSGYAIAKETGILQSQISVFMNGKGGLQQSNIDKICKLIGAELVLTAKRKKKQS